MVDIETDTARRNEVTFVRAVVTNDRSTPQRVRLRNRLDGPVWPPRYGDVTAPEWNDGTWESVLEPGQRIGVGYACPAPVTTDDPVELVSSSRASMDAAESPEEVLASLDEWAPERSVSEHGR